MSRTERPWPPLAADHPLVVDPDAKCPLCDGPYEAGDRTAAVSYSPRRIEEGNEEVMCAHLNCAVAYDRGWERALRMGEGSS